MDHIPPGALKMHSILSDRGRVAAVEHPDPSVFKPDLYNQCIVVIAESGQVAPLRIDRLRLAHQEKHIVQFMGVYLQQQPAGFLHAGAPPFPEKGSPPRPCDRTELRGPDLPALYDLMGLPEEGN